MRVFSFLKEFKIPTILGLSIILAGIIAGVFLVMKDKTFKTFAAPDLNPTNVTITNITDSSATISWQTSAPTTGFVKYGQASPNEQTQLDDRDSKAPTYYATHYVTISNLLPKTTYQYQITSGKLLTATKQFTTATPLTSQNGFSPIIGSVSDNNQPVQDAIAYLSIEGASNLSALIKNNGNFLVPLTVIRNSALTDSFSLTEGNIAKLNIISANGQAAVMFKVKSGEQILPAFKLGDNLELTNVTPPVQNSTPVVDQLAQYDLNSDGQINSTDVAILLRNWGKNPKDQGADLNKDGIVDQKDLDIMNKHLNQ